MIVYVLKARAIRKGPVRIEAEGILHGRVGDVQGFLEVAGKRLCLVAWESGGWTLFAEESLTQVPVASESKKP